MGSSEGNSKSARDWEKLWEIFHHARELNPADRIDFLNNLDSADQKFRAAVENLLEAEKINGPSFENIVNDELILLENCEESARYEIKPDMILAERFLIIRELGRGGMGTVYEAFDQQLESNVALKLMQPDLLSDSGGRERFHREINLARKVTHPNACRIFDLFQHEDLLFLTMELLWGKTLKEHIKQNGRIDLHSTTDIVLQILNALSEMHRVGIVHRDLKASNIILVPNGNKVRAVVTDFGLAVGLSGNDTFELTQTGEVLGTPQYMAPEQLKKEAISPATDVYAMGLVLYEMLTGELPLKGESPLTIAAKRISEDAPSPKILIPQLDHKWERIILQCLERNPKHRFKNAADLAGAIHGKSIASRIPIVPSRHRNRVALSFLIFLTILSGLFYFWQTKNAALSISNNDVISKRIWTGATGTPAGAISTDGKVLVDIDWAKADVMTIDLKTKKKRLLTESKVWFHPYDHINHPVVTTISPDGKTVAYSIGFKRSGSELRGVSIMGSQPAVLFRTIDAWITPMDWSSDGQHIAAHILQKDGSVNIGLVSIRNASFRKLKTVHSTDIRKISFSPDSQYVAYDFPQSNNSPNHDLFLISLKTGSETRIITHDANDYLLGWSPIGSKLIYASDRSGTNDAWNLQIVDGKAEGNSELVRKDIGQIFPLKITNDGSLYYAHLMSAVDVYTANLDASSSLSRISQGDVGFSRSPTYSRDGKSLAFQSLVNPLSSRWSAAQQNVLLKIISLQSAEMKQIDLKILSPGGRMRWSPDGKSILLRGDDGKQGPGLYSIDLESGNFTKVIADISSNWIRQYHMSADGKSIFYLMNKDAPVVRKDITTRKEVEIYKDVADFDLSYDGRWLAAMTTDIYKGFSLIQIVSVNDSRSKTIYKLPMPHWISSIAWMPDGESLIFSVGRRDLIDAPHQMWKISKNGAYPKDLGISSEYLTDIRIHPDGKRIAMSTVTDNSEVWIMENFLTVID
ncbi:protein kinase [bacterium]|nr:protein kinase [bacterium]